MLPGSLSQEQTQAVHSVFSPAKQGKSFHALAIHTFTLSAGRTCESLSINGPNPTYQMHTAFDNIVEVSMCPISTLMLKDYMFCRDYFLLYDSYAI